MPEPALLREPRPLPRRVPALPRDAVERDAVERELLARELLARPLEVLADFERDEEDDLLREPLLRASWALRMFRFAAARCRVVAMVLSP